MSWVPNGIRRNQVNRNRESPKARARSERPVGDYLKGRVPERNV